MITGLALGAGLGLGVFVLARVLLGAPAPLAVTLAELERPRLSIAARHALDGLDRAEAWQHRLGRRTVQLLEGLGLDLGGVRRDLRVTGRTIERHSVDKLLAALVGLGFPNVLGLLLAASGDRGAVAPLATGGLLLGALGFFVPDLLLREEVKRRRDAFRHALSAYLDLVNVLLAGSAGIETALEAAADAGDGWVFAEIRGCLDRARVLRRSPWESFATLGTELGVDELIELAASVRLAGEQGAKIKSSLAAKAAALRGHQLARTEAAAQAASDRMALPNVLMFVGFIVFIGYPAFVSIVAS